MEKIIGCGTVIVLVIAVLFGVFNKYVFGNKQLIDLKQNFNVAYVLADDGKFQKVSISAWKDWENSDAIQVVTKDGKPIYTHLRNVKLTREEF